MENALISIAMATYNGEKYLREQLDSILNQTYSYFELIICDDCSKDSTWEILEEYAQKDQRLKIYKNEQNLGFKRNFEKAISLCKGDYIALSDQDDIWLPNHLEFLLNNIGDKSISGANAELIDFDGQSMNKKLNQVDNFLFFPDTSEFLWRLLLRSDPIQGASMLLRRDFINKCLPIPNAVKYHDAWFATCSCFENGLSYSFDIITQYRQHGNNVTFLSHNSDKRKKIEAIRSKFYTFFTGAYTDRFDYVGELFNKYGNQLEEFNKIRIIVEHLKEHRLTFRDVRKLWKNYYSISTTKSHKGFLKSLIVWLRWRSFEEKKH